MNPFVPPIEMTPERFHLCRQLAHLSYEDKRAIFAQLSDEETLFFRYTWEAWAQDRQLAQLVNPDDRWTFWTVRANRGYGKTRTGAEWIRQQAESNQVEWMLLMGPTLTYVRNIMIEGESGILSISPPWFRPQYQSVGHRLIWPNGAMALSFSVEKPELLRGFLYEKAWVDECNDWDTLLFRLRLGSHPQCVVTMTHYPIGAELRNGRVTHIDDTTLPIKQAIKKECSGRQMIAWTPIAHTFFAKIAIALSRET